VAWVTGSPELVGAVRTAKQFLTCVASGPFQSAIAEATRDPWSGYLTRTVAVAVDEARWASPA
jgi:N-succinyldiaminopimelate aminotransferase